MNRRVASSQQSPVGDTQLAAPRAHGEVAAQSDSAHDGSAGATPRQKKQSVGKDKTQSTGKQAEGKPATGKGVKGAPGDVGQMLRGAYRQTVDEAIPDDLMDLLNRLE